MPWFTVDDGFADHPKVIQCSLAAIGLWTKAGSYCAHHLTDGKIPKAMVRVWGGTPKLAAELVASGLWLDTGPDHYEFHDWGERNPLSAEVKAKRAADAARKKAERAESRRSPNGRPHGHMPDVRAESDEHNADPSGGSPRARARVPSHPIPSHPIPTESETRARPDPDQDPDEADEPWRRLDLTAKLVTDLAALWDGAGGLTVSPKLRAVFEARVPMLRAAAAKRGGDPVEEFRTAAARFRADPVVREKKLGLPVLLSQLDQWLEDAPARATEPTDRRAYHAEWQPPADER